MKRKMVLVLDVETTRNVDMQEMADDLSQAIQGMDDLVLHKLVLFDNDENNADTLVANVKKEL